MANTAQARKRARQAEDHAPAQREPEVGASHRRQEGEEGDRIGRQGRRGQAARGVAVGDRPHRRQEDRAQEPRVAHEVAPRAGDQGDGLTAVTAVRSRSLSAARRQRCRRAGSTPSRGASGRPLHDWRRPGNSRANLVFGCCQLSCQREFARLANRGVGPVTGRNDDVRRAGVESRRDRIVASRIRRRCAPAGRASRGVPTPTTGNRARHADVRPCRNPSRRLDIGASGDARYGMTISSILPVPWSAFASVLAAPAGHDERTLAWAELTLGLPSPLLHERARGSARMARSCGHALHCARRPARRAARGCRPGPHTDLRAAAGGRTRDARGDVRRRAARARPARLLLGDQRALRDLLLHRPDRRGDPVHVRNARAAAHDRNVAAARGRAVEPRRGARHRRRLRTGARARAGGGRAARELQQSPAAALCAIEPRRGAARHRRPRRRAGDRRCDVRASHDRRAAYRRRTTIAALPPRSTRCIGRVDDAERVDRVGRRDLRDLTRWLQRGPSALGGSLRRVRARRRRSRRRRPSRSPPKQLHATST